MEDSVNTKKIAHGWLANKELADRRLTDLVDRPSTD